MINRYKGECHYCYQFVGAGEGIYYNGWTLCSELVYSEQRNLTTCLATYNRQSNTDFATSDEANAYERQVTDQRHAENREQVRLALVNGRIAQLATEANVRSLEQVIIKVCGSDIPVADMTWEQATAMTAELHRRINRRDSAGKLKEAKRTNTCNRCGGAGQADKWAFTGYVCYDCGGSGKFYKE